MRFAFSGFAAMSPVMLAALFWKRSNKWGALASTIFVAVSIAVVGVLSTKYPPNSAIVPAGEGAIPWLSLAPNGDVRVWGFMTVVPMVLGSALSMFLVAHHAAAEQSHDRQYFPPRDLSASAGTPPVPLNTKVPEGAPVQ